MSEREYMIIGLVRDLLDPCNGPFDKLSQQQDTGDDYITKFLAPKMQQRDYEDMDANSEEISDDEETGTGEGAVIASPCAFSPALDPKAQPRSAGLSFVLLPDESGQIPVIDICATWARYDRQTDAAWQCHPGHALLRGVPVSSALRTSVGDDVDLYMHVSPGTGQYRVSLYLINERQVASGVHPTSADFLCRPQIRIDCTLGKLAPVDIAVSQTSDDLSSRETTEPALLYRKRSVLSCGYLYDVTQKAADPERGVVLDNAQHQQRGLPVAFEQAQNSLRTVEETTQFKDGLAELAVRCSQFITTYGPGAILEGHAGPCLIPVLGRANVFVRDRSMQRFEISDNRLSATLLQQARIVRLPSHAELHLAELHNAYETLAFPVWALCPIHQVLYNKYSRPADNRACPKCAPFPQTANQQNEIWMAVRKQAIRFVMACLQGHLDDVPWDTIIAHTKASCQPPYLLWQGSGSALRKSTIVCPDCGGSMNLGVAYGREWRCSGRYPERGDTRVDCEASAKMVQRGAANLYMPELHTSLTIPPANAQLYRILQSASIRLFLDSEAALTRDVLLPYMKKMASKGRISENIVRELECFSESDVNEVIHQIVTEELPQDNRALRHQEFAALRTIARHGASALRANTPGGPAQFEVVRPRVHEYIGPGGHRLRVTPVSRLRVVMVQTGYRRLDPLQGNLVSIKHSDEHDESSWYPGIELFGEGIYIDLAPSAPADQAHFALEYARNWQVAWQDPAAYHQRIQQPEERDSLHPVFVWWHTFAHRVINALSIDSGYSSAAVRERVFIDIN